MKVLLVISALVAIATASPFLREQFGREFLPRPAFVPSAPRVFTGPAIFENELAPEFPENEDGLEFLENDDGLEFPENEDAPEHIENEFGPEFVPEWNLIADGNGNLHLSNLHEEDPTINPTWNVNTDVIFRLFTARNPTAGQVLTVGNSASITNSNFRANEPTRFIIHGWNNNGGSPVNTRIRTAYLNRGAFNVIVVDWGAGAQTSNYAAARNRIFEVGPRVAQMADFLNQAVGASFAQMVVVGHSLGGHTAGLAGKRTSRGRLAAVVAMDPAGPGFDINRPAERVAPTDANYVEVIHTNGGLLGMDPPIGLSDHYPNFGRTQPGCGVDLAGTCAHSRAWEFFAESITTTTHFTARLCRNFADITGGNCVSSGTQRRMGGEPLTTAARGVYWCSTNAAAPFARGAAGA